MRAGKSLCAMIVGEEIAWRRGLSQQVQDVNQQFEEVAADSPNTRNNIEKVVEPLAETLGTVKATMSVRQEFELASQGKLPAGVLPFSMESADWVWHCYVYSAEVSTLADKTRKATLEQSVKERGENLKRSLRILENGQPAGKDQGGSRDAAPARDRDDLGNERPLEKAPSGRVTKDKDL